MPTDVFISYSSRDVLTATAICKALEGAGVACWIAPRNILPGQTWSEAIIDGLNDSQVMVLLYSAASNASPQVLREVERAVSKRLGLLAFRVEDVSPSKAMEYLISVSHWHDATTGPLETHLQKMVESVHALLATRGEPATPVMPAMPPPTVSAPSPSPIPNNLPAAMTSFVGRVQAKADVKDRLSAARLLTLVGPGGSGKTRLALQVASEVRENYPDGVWLVELAALTEPEFVPATVAAALNISEQPGRPLLQTLAQALACKRLLLLLDNCEHLLEPCANLAANLLRACPELRLLATSRAALNVAGEAMYRVPSLSLPDPKKRPPLDALRTFEAVHLFVDRATLTQPAFALTEANAPAVADICQHLDGIPLAIELAAARVRGMSVEQIAARLDDRFKLLTGGARTALPHQQTLRALLDWSYALLTDPEKSLLQRLSVFAGGWSLEAAEQVCANTGKREEIEGKRASDPSLPCIEDWEILDLLLSLVDKSLAVYEEEGETARYRLLETVRHYAGEKCRQAGEDAWLCRQHRNFFLTLVEAAEPGLFGPEQARTLELLEAEHDNIRAALTFCREEDQGGEAGLRLAAGLQRFWRIRGYLTEGRDLLATALAHPSAQEPTALRALALNAAGILADLQGDYAAARNSHEEALAIRRALGDKQGIASTLNSLGNMAEHQSDYVGAHSLFEESLALMRESGDKRGTATVLNNLGNVVLAGGDQDAARAHYEQSLALMREMGDKQCMAGLIVNLGNVAEDQGDAKTARSLYEQGLALYRELGDKRGIGSALTNIGAVLQFQGDDTAARTLFEESLVLQRELGDRRSIAYSLHNIGLMAQRQDGYMEAAAYFAESLPLFCELGDKHGIAECFESIAAGAVDRGQHRRAVVLYGSATSLREAIGTPLAPSPQAVMTERLGQAHAALGAEAYLAAEAHGRSLSQEQAIAYALAQEEV